MVVGITWPGTVISGSDPRRQSGSFSGTTFKNGRREAVSRPNEVRATGSVVTQMVTPSDLDQLDDFYRLDDRQEVRGLIANHPVVLPLLLAASEVIEDYFQTPVRVTLDTWESPEDDEVRTLYVFIHSNLERGLEREQMDKFRREWLYEAAGNALPFVHFTLG